MVNDSVKIKEAMDVAKNHIISSKTLLDMGQYRNSITLSYYAMYTAAYAALIKKESNPGTHEGVLSEFARLYVKDGSFSHQIYKTFSYAKASRKDASYDFSINFSEDLAQNTFWDAQIFVEEIEKLLLIK